MAKNGRKWPKMAENGPKMAENDQKWAKMAKSGQNWPENGRKWPTMAIFFWLFWPFLTIFAYF